MKEEERTRLWEKHRPYVEILSQVNNSYVFVAEWHTRGLFISPNYNEFFDYIPDYQFLDLEERGEIIDTAVHPDDLPFVKNLQERVFDYIFSLPVEERKDYKHIFEFRVLGPVRIFSKR